MSSPPSSPPCRISKKRRRVYSNSENLSSDPVFSSDDLQDASIEHYEAPRKKKHVRGPWWRGSHSSKLDSKDHSKPKTSFSRNFDSGVWMGSDDSDQSLPSLPEYTCNDGNHPLNSTAPSYQMSQLNAAEVRAQEIIEGCLDRNWETVDLSGLGLVSIRDSVLRALKTLCIEPLVHGVPSSDDYRKFVPSLKLILSGNSLSTVPTEIWRFENLAVISFRDNALSDLPASVGRLKNLTSLSIAKNNLRWLPWELLSLLPPHGHLFDTNLVSGNSFVYAHSLPHQTLNFKRTKGLDMTKIERICEASGEAGNEPYRWLERLHQNLEKGSHDLEETDESALHDHLRTIAPILIGTTAISKFNRDGSLAKDSALNPSATPRSQRAMKSYLLGDSFDYAKSSNSAAHSLFELALRTAATAVPLSELRAYLPVDLPSPIENAMEEAATSELEDGRNCSVCGRKYIIPRAEWIEFWHCGYNQPSLNMREVFLPFLRRACSWSCSDWVYAKFQKVEEAGCGSPVRDLA